MIDGGTVMILCITCVKECDKEERKEFCMVGNKIFLMSANTDHEEEVEQIFIPLMQENTVNGQYM
jgi:hypothetical protein